MILRAILIIAALWPVGAAAKVYEGRMEASDARPGSLARDYLIYAPQGVAKGAALVTMLHGCKQTHHDIAIVTGFNDIADALAADDDPTNDAVILYPFMTSHAPHQLREKNCWGFWLEEERQEGRGEPGDLRALIALAEARFETDPNRRFVAGFSSGAAMATIMAVVYSEDIAAAASVAGPPYGETAFSVALPTYWHHWWGVFYGVDGACLAASTHHSAARIAQDILDEQHTAQERALTPIFAAQSVNDCRAPVNNTLRLREAWALRHQGGAPEAQPSCSGETPTPCELTRVLDASGRLVVETALYEGRKSTQTHYWMGDGAGPFANPEGPSLSALIMDFFQRVSGPIQ